MENDSENGADSTQPAQVGAEAASPTVSMQQVPQEFGKPLS